MLGSLHFATQGTKHTCCDLIVLIEEFGRMADIVVTELRNMPKLMRHGWGDCCSGSVPVPMKCEVKGWQQHKPRVFELPKVDMSQIEKSLKTPDFSGWVSAKASFVGSQEEHQKRCFLDPGFPSRKNGKKKNKSAESEYHENGNHHFASRKMLGSLVSEFSFLWTNRTKAFTPQGLEEVKVATRGHLGFFSPSKKHHKVHTTRTRRTRKRLAKNSYDSLDLILARTPRMRCVDELMFLPSLFLW